MASNGELKKRTCRHCGCHEFDACYHPDFGNCFWVTDDECSHCIEIPGEAVRWSLFPKGTNLSNMNKAYSKVIKERKEKVSQPD